MTTKFNPNLQNFMMENARTMTNIMMNEKMSPIYNIQNERQEIKEARKTCPHFVIENGELVAPWNINEKTHKIHCNACHREWDTQLDKAASEDDGVFMKAIEEINKMLAFGPSYVYNIPPRDYDLLLNLLRPALSRAAQLHANLLQFTKLEDNLNNEQKEIATEYGDSTIFTRRL